MLEADILIFCAGFGTRLKPLTLDTPKPLIEVGGKSLLLRHLQHLHNQGATRVIINLHHLGDKIKTYLSHYPIAGLEIVFSEEPVILDTGGTIRDIEPLLRHRSLITVNGDVLISPCFSYPELLAKHLAESELTLSTMVLREDREQKKFGEIGVDDQGRVVEFLGASCPGGSVSKRYMYTGIQIVSREIQPCLPERGVACSITRDVLKPLVARGELIKGVVFGGQWFDIGTPERLEQARKELIETPRWAEQG